MRLTASSAVQPVSTVFHYSAILHYITSSERYLDHAINTTRLIYFLITGILRLTPTSCLLSYTTYQYTPQRPILIRCVILNNAHQPPYLISSVFALSSRDPLRPFSLPRHLRYGTCAPASYIPRRQPLKRTRGSFPPPGESERRGAVSLWLKLFKTENASRLLTSSSDPPNTFLKATSAMSPFCLRGEPDFLDLTATHDFILGPRLKGVVLGEPEAGPRASTWRAEAKGRLDGCDCSCC